MSRITLNGQIFVPHEYALEVDFERDVVGLAREVFGDDTLYIDVKKRIGEGNIVTIPDAYLLSFTIPSDPRLYIIENELVRHDPFRHIGQQLLRFAISYRESGRKIKRFLSEVIMGDSAMKSFVEGKAVEAGYRNVDVLLDSLVFERPVSAVVVIDEVTGDLEKVLGQLTMGTDTIEFKAYRATDGTRLHHFTPFQPELREDSGTGAGKPSPEEIDTVVVPAREDGFQETFLGEDRWYQIRMSASMLDRVRYIAAYRTSPESAITHVAEVASIEKWADTNKYVVNFKGAAREIKRVTLPQDNVSLALQNIRYTSYRRLMAAKTLADLF